MNVYEMLDVCGCETWCHRQDTHTEFTFLHCLIIRTVLILQCMCQNHVQYELPNHHIAWIWCREKFASIPSALGGGECWSRGAPKRTVFDAELLWQFQFLTHRQQTEISRKLGFDRNQILALLDSLAYAASWFSCIYIALVCCHIVWSFGYISLCHLNKNLSFIKLTVRMCLWHYALQAWTQCRYSLKPRMSVVPRIELVVKNCYWPYKWEQVSWKMNCLYTLSCCDVMIASIHHNWMKEKA